MTRTELLQCRTADIALADPDSLADLREISIDPAQPIGQRLDSLMAQTRNPYLFKVGDVVVKIDCGGGKQLDDALTDLMCTG